ncbi:hypothetical protein FA10DRAFT_172015 [Acaromyces ingoldii]|uniref:Uncharacterized protein n=1 Tax=Acaromyces ingoldii TaxID=215250 RepID=A0A316YHP6_9BASI|nr:hypothetical protein FA10DRAFT_172015 [Acaromyces ingoldii]PWN88729.1 hypothetical protein FA10DRAFT_172015 [Acaromyces ingoldii]
MNAARKNLTAALLLAITVAVAMTFVAAAPPGLSSLGRSAMDCPTPMSMSRNDKCDPRDVNTWSQELRTGLTRFYGDALQEKKIDGEKWLDENPTDEDKACKKLFASNNCQREMHDYFERKGARPSSALVQKRGLGDEEKHGGDRGFKCTEEQRKMCQAQTCTAGCSSHSRAEGLEREYANKSWRFCHPFFFSSSPFPSSLPSITFPLFSSLSSCSSPPKSAFLSTARSSGFVLS